MDISIPYYEDLTRISNSNVGWFLTKGPAYLHKMLTNPPPEEKNSTLERGTMIHEYILQPEEFQKDYVVWTEAKPSSVQQETFCNELANTLEIEPEKAILSAYKKAYSTRGKTDAQMLSDGQEMALKLAKYIDFLKSKDTRTMISAWDVKMLKDIEKNVKSHKLANSIINSPKIVFGWNEEMGLPSTRHAEENHHEFHINWEFNGLKCKSLLDGLTLDFENKVAIIYDLKTTQKLWHFEDSINQYDYMRQLCYYTMAVNWYLSEELEQDPSEWGIKWYIIGIDTTGSNEIRVFEFTEEQVWWSRYEIIAKALEEITWHFATHNWEHSKEYYNGDGSESLIL